MWAIYLVLAGVTVVTESEIAWQFIVAGVLVWLLRALPKWLTKGGRLHAVGFTQIPVATA